jgi:type IV secretion system protein VirB5
MSTHTALRSNDISLKQRDIVDEVANDVYAAHYRERRVARFAIASLATISFALTGAVVVVANRPTITRYVRIDDAGRAQAIQYSDLNYSPREGEIRTYLTDWANYRHTINRETITKKYPMQFYFLSSQLASQLIRTDNANHLTTQVNAGQMEPSDIQVNNVTITSMTQERISGAVVARGTALMTFDLIYSPDHSQKPRTEHWVASVTYYINPAQVSDQAKTNPQYETINPLGVTITEFHENLSSVDALAEGTTYHPEAK